MSDIVIKSKNRLKCLGCGNKLFNCFEAKVVDKALNTFMMFVVECRSCHKVLFTHDNRRKEDE